MSKEFEQEFINEAGETVKIYVDRPDNDSIKEADIHRAKIWNKAFKEGVLTKKEVESAMKKRGLWSDEKAQKEVNLTTEILELEKKLYVGSGKKRPNLSDGRKLAIEMREKRIELRDLIQERISMDENTAESLADNARFDYLVSCCSFYSDTEEHVFENYEDYNDQSTSTEAMVSAQLLARMMYNLEADYEEKLPENRFLTKFNLINEDGFLVDPNNPEVLVDAEGKPVNEEGFYVDKDGERTDDEGNKLNEEGYYEIADYENDLVEKPKKTRARRKTTATKKRATKKAAPEKASVSTEEQEQEQVN